MTAQKNCFTIGKLSKKTGVKIETIRYYEKTGIIPKPERSQSGYRLYDGTALQNLSFVRRCRELGFSLDEIRNLLKLVIDHSYTCEEVRNLMCGHIESIKRR